MTLNPKNIDLTWFLAIFGCKRVNYDEMDGDRLRLPANRNCYRLSRVSWALLKLLVVINIAHVGLLDQRLSRLSNRKLFRDVATCHGFARFVIQLDTKSQYVVLLVLALTTCMSRVDFCNALFAGLPAPIQSRRCSVYKMHLHDLFFNLNRATISHKDFVNFTGYRSVHESSLQTAYVMYHR